MKNITAKMLKKLSVFIREFYFALRPDALLLEKMQKLHSLTIEVTNICNANCVFCGYQYMLRQKQVMNDEIYNKTIAQFDRNGGGNLSLTTVVGDPLLDPKFLDRIRYARSFKNIKKITAITNCINLNVIGAKELLLSGISEIGISMTAFSPEMYQRVYRNSQYVKMKENVLDLLRMNKELRRPVKIHIYLRIDKLFQEIRDLPGFTEVISLADSVETNSYFDSWDGRIKQHDLPARMRLRPRWYKTFMHTVPCSMMYSGVGVLVDGTVTVCPCRDLNGDSELVIGNIHQEDLSTMFYSDKLEGIRNRWCSGKGIPDICRDCSHYNPYSHMMLKEVREHLFYV